MKNTRKEGEKLWAFLERGVASVYPSKEYVTARLLEGKKLKVYFGIDPTGPTLHLGHMIGIKKLAEFQELGHSVVLLIGDFTAMIGDPTDKGATRKQLSRKEILTNMKLYKKQASALLRFSGKNKAEIAYNSKWLGKMKFGDVLDLASKMTVQQMLERDMFERRIEEGKPIHIHEFLYPLMQGYDSVAMQIDGEIGGNDQTFNMLAGRTLEKLLLDKEKFVIATKLLEDATGKKMGKTEGNMVSLIDTPKDMFGKIMSWTDGLIIPAFELCTMATMEDIEAIKESLVNGANPRDAKARLAREIVSLYHGEKKGKEAEDAFFQTFQRGEVPTDIQTEKAKKDEQLVAVLLRLGVVSSKSEWRRLVEEGAVTHLESDTKITDPQASPELGTYKIGKKRFLKITK
ncbi:MAG: tyrosine--tRNA ligase [Candidatus Pacebacteria bacterium]|jgi:tyrosyl-tRNA synthetase|nr:tyrosine--tRNA ligase [Candidatus Paceibacterota bacterium]